MKRALTALLLSGIFNISGCSQTPPANDRDIPGGCEDCALMYDGIPDNITWESRINPAGEAGEPMIITGRLLKKDGKTPAAGVLLYVYHTDNTGRYSNPGRKGNRHGHLRGWMKTRTDGRYSFTSIRPAAYPGRTDPAHVHALIKEEGIKVYWLDDYLFDDDPLITPKVRSRHEKRGGDGIIHLTKNEKGVWVGERDIVLGLNIPNY